MEDMNHHHSKQNSSSDIDRWTHLLAVHAPETLLPNVLDRLQLTGAYASGETSVEALMTALRDPAWQVRAATIHALGALGEHALIEPLVVALNDEDALVRAAAVRALASLGERAPLEPLLTALHDPDWLVREIAAMMLGTLGKRVPVEHLVAAVQDENAFVCRAAALALVQAHFATSQDDDARVRQPAPIKRQRYLRLLEGGLVALLVVSMLFTWLPRLQFPHLFVPGHHPPATQQGTILFTFQAGQGIESSPVWLSKTNYLALLSSFGYSVQVWDPVTEYLVRNPLEPVFFTGPHTASGWSWSPDGRYLAATSEDIISRDAAVQVWDAVTGSNTLTVHSHANGLLHIAWSFDSTRIAYSGDDGLVHIWDGLAGQELLTLVGHHGKGHRLFWSADGQLLLLGSPDGTFQLWNTITSANISTFRSEPSVLVALSPGGRWLVSTDDQEALHVLDTFTGRELVTYQGPPEGVSFLEWLPEGRRILTANTSEVQIWDAITGQTLLKFPNPAVSATWQSSSERSWIFTANASEVQVWDGITGHILLAPPNPASSRAWQVSPDGRYVAFSSWNNGVQVRDALTGREIASYQSHTTHVQVLAWSSDSQRIAFASTDGTVHVWNMITESGIVTYQGLADVVSLGWSPDDKLIATTSADSTVRVLQAT